MRLQKGLDGKTPIDVEPRYLLVPAALEVVALHNVAQITAAQSSNVNPFTGKIEVVVDPRLDAYSASVWYMAADPGQIAGLEYSFLDGFAGPQILMNPGFDVDGVEWKVFMDYGSGVVEYRGLYMNG